MLVSLFPIVFSYQFVNAFRGMKISKWLPENRIVSASQIITLPSILSKANDPFASYNELYATRSSRQRRGQILSTELQSALTSLSMENPVVSIEVEEIDSFVQSLDFAKSVADVTSSVSRMDVLMAMEIIFPSIDAFVQFIN